MLVFGARAGAAAATYAASAGPPPASITAQARDEVRRLERLLGTPPGDDGVAPIRDEMQKTMEDAAGIYRTGAEMEAGADRLRELQEARARVGIWDSSRNFNTELVAALELANLLDVAETMLASGCAGRSRAAPISAPTSPDARRREVPHPPARRPRQDGAPQISDLPVTITRWPPGERTYGR